MCTKAPSTVDYETASRGGYLQELESCIKRFNGALTMTMDSYRDLLTAFDRMGQVFGNLAGDLNLEVKQPLIEMRDGMRDLKDKGPFVTFNTDVHEGTISVLDPLREKLKAAHKSLSDLKSRQKDYDNLRYRIEKKEKEYAKKDKALTTSESYHKDIEKRDKCKAQYEEKRESFEAEVKNLKDTTGKLILKSMNNYLHSSATLSGYLEATMNMYRTDLDEEGNPTRAIRMDRVKQEAERRSVTKRRQTATTISNGGSVANISAPDTQPRVYPADSTPAPAIQAEESALKSPPKMGTSTSRLSHASAKDNSSSSNHHHNNNDLGPGAGDGGEGLFPSEAPRNPLNVQ